VVVQVKALARELPAARGLPLSRLSTAGVAEEARRSGLVAMISDTTVWRWLHEWKFTTSDLASLMARMGDDTGRRSRRKVA